MTQDKALEILKSGHNVFLTGEPGAGKTYTINLFTEWLDKRRVSYAVTASTGIAASHINGSTIHSWSGIGIMKNLDEADINSIRYNVWSFRRIASASVLILDEVSMLDATTLDDVDRVLKAIHKNDLPFGGIQVVLVGDFFQLPPVSRDGTARFAFESEAWETANMKVCYLTEQHRQSDPVFTEILTAMRLGSMTEDHMRVITSRMSAEAAATTLFTHNRDVESMNLEMLSRIDSPSKTWTMFCDGDPKKVETLKKNCLSPEHLTLKVGAVVMFTANKPSKGYLNGTIGVVESLASKSDEDVPLIRLLDGSKVVPEMNSWKAYDERKTVRASVSQLPLKLAWAITVHKSQGMSLDAASIDLSSAFEYGHGYVAISRVRSLQGLHLKGISANAFKVHPKVMEQDKKFRAIGS